MGFWHDHGVIDFSVFPVRGRNSDVTGIGEVNACMFDKWPISIGKCRVQTERLTRQNICSILKPKRTDVLLTSR